jgi:transcriptional regulator with XRE-family HTH domain
MESKMNLWLSRQLAKRRMSQGDLSRQTGLSRATISRLISGERYFTPNCIAHIAVALNIPAHTVIRNSTLHPRFEEVKRGIIRYVKAHPEIYGLAKG